MVALEPSASPSNERSSEDLTNAQSTRIRVILFCDQPVRILGGGIGLSPKGQNHNLATIGKHCCAPGHVNSGLR